MKKTIEKTNTRTGEVTIRPLNQCYTPFDLPPRNDYFDNTPSRTRKEASDECDVNKILARYAKTGVLTHLNPNSPLYTDVSSMPNSYQDALEFIRVANEDFQGLSAELRARFQNDPQNLINFIQDQKNWEEAAKLGLLDKDKVEAVRVQQSAQKTEAENAEVEKHIAIAKKIDKIKV